MSEYTTARELALKKAITPPEPLKPCPFCGDIAVLEPISIWGTGGFVVRCCQCAAKALFSLTGYTIETEDTPKTYYTDEAAKLRACKSWNRRKEEAAANVH